MKLGYRKPSIKKSISARTTGKINRTVKKITTPGYGKKGVGYIKDPSKAIYNKVYNKSSKSVFDTSDNNSQNNISQNGPDNITPIISIIFFVIFIIIMIWLWNFFGDLLD